MNDWRQITEADVLTKISSTELDSFRSIALATDQQDPVDAAIESVTALVRGYVASNSSNDLDIDATTVPVRLIPAAVDILVVDIPARAAGTQIDPDDVRSTAKAQAIKLLERVADGKFSIADPVTGQESSSGGAKRLTRNRPRASRRSLRHL